MSKKHSGKNHPFYGKKHTEETRQKHRCNMIGNVLSMEIKNKLSDSGRKAWKNPSKRIKMIHTLKWNNMSVDKGQLELLEKWNKLGFNFNPNYHFKEPQKSKDLIRQDKIISVLNPKKFRRYNAVNKTFTEIISNKKQEPTTEVVEQKGIISQIY